jgi:hypothetical protein
MADLSDYADNIFYKTVSNANDSLTSLSDSFSGVIKNILDIFSGNSIGGLNLGDGATAVGISLTTLFFAMAVFSEVSAFRVERFEEAIRVAMKFIVAKIIIENTNVISGAIYALFTGLSKGALDSGLTSLSTSLATITPSDTGMDPLGTGLGWLIQIFTQVLPAYIITIFVFATILLTVCGIVFEIGIHMAAAPIALSTLCNDMTRPTGISFIKSYSAVCLQAFILGACLSVYSVISAKFAGVTAGIASDGIFGGLLGGLMPIIGVICLSTVMKRSGEITKRMFGA